MPPLRPSIFPLYRGYVCSSCTVKIQSGAVPPWLARKGRNYATKTQTKGESGKRQPKKERYPVNKEKVVIKYFDEGKDGSWIPEHEQDLDEDEDIFGRPDIKAILSRASELENDLKDAKVGATENNPFPHLPFYNEIAAGKFNLVDLVQGGMGIDQDSIRAAADSFSKRTPPSQKDRKMEIRQLRESLAELETGFEEGEDDPELDTLRTLIKKMEGNLRMEIDHNARTKSDPFNGILGDEEGRFPGLESEEMDEDDLRALLPKNPVKTKDGRELDVKGLLAAITATSVTAHSISIPVGAFPEDRQVNILRLNVALERMVKRDSDKQSPKELWKWYSLSRKGLAANWDQVPSDVWAILWSQFSTVSESNPDRMPHIRRLAEDMRAAGVKLANSQTLLYLEALFLDGENQMAIREWESSRAALIYESSIAADYWALGSRMLANDRRPDEAQQAAELLLQASNGKKDFRVLLPIIRSWLLSPDKASFQKAWATYIRFKFLVGSDVTMDDYDAVTGAFLDVKQTDLALGVFRDMMMTGDPCAYHHDSVALYKRYQTSLGNLQSINFWPEETAWKSHEPFTSLLPKQKNKFFLGSWIKKLIGDNRVDSAAQVLELMYERGIPPDARHVNGVIGAWFRSGTTVHQKKAEEMAWRLIGDRLKFVKMRNQKSELSGPVRAVLSKSKEGFKRLPASQISVLATSETFSILIEYYQKRQKHERVQELYDMIGAAQISPSTSFLNDMLLIGVRSHGTQWAWATYQKMIKHGVKPDIITFGLLWQLMKAYVNPVKNRARIGFPSCRGLFAEMARWSGALQADGISRDVYELIVLCFGLAGDQIGTAVSLRAMHQFFNISPDQNTVRSVAMQLCKVGIKGSGKPRRRLNLNSENKKKIAQIAMVLGNLKDERMKVLEDQGVIVDEMDTDQRSEESILLLCDVLKYAIQTNNKRYIEASWEDANTRDQTDSVARMGQKAAEEMGVPNYAPWGHV